jgi:hypothetical protein
MDRMRELSSAIEQCLAALDAAKGAPEFTPNQKLGNAICVAARVFEHFLCVHPYANGNGHAARLALIAILGRCGFWTTRFPIEPRPPDPPYGEAIVAYRNGDPLPLELYILALFTPNQARA